jgi:polyisoprenoid-binding protein YceI
MHKTTLAATIFGISALALLGAGCNQTSTPEPQTQQDPPVSAEAMDTNQESDNAMENSNKKLVDTSASKLVWTAEKVTGKHFGNLSLVSGELDLNEGVPTGGSFLIDMNSMTVEDLKDGDGLLQHLKSDDFFSVESNPEAKFELTACEHNEGDNYQATGNLTIKGIAAPISFPITLTTQEDGKIHVAGTATVDRTTYDIKFRSGKFFSDLGDSLIKDEFTIELDLITV